MKLHHAQLAGTPDLLALHAAHSLRYPFLLQSVAGHPTSGRYDLLFGFPEWESAETVADGPDFFARLSATVAAVKAPDLPRGLKLPFIGGWFVFLAYEAAALVEHSLTLPSIPFALPRAIAVRCPAAVLIDRERGSTHVISQRGSAQLAELVADCSAAVEGQAAPNGPLVGKLEEDDPAHYLAGCAKVLEYLKAGDTFQINLSRAWRAELNAGVDAAALYRRLCAANPAPFAGLAKFAGATVLSSSPERLISIEGRSVQTRPIAGTRPRGATAEEDAALQAQLAESLKERAEHVMLIDLERNDLGRVCEPGSVEVSELMRLETYTHVHHIVSNVRGTLRAEVGVGEAIAAVFPGGTITGCPKVRAMQIIAELEGVGRGAYTGAMGYICCDGKADLNILIRSLVVEHGQVTLRAGAGIVADSVPEQELAETRSKAKGLLQALGVEA